MPLVEEQIPRSPCAGCRFLRRKCHPDCTFAPYFPANQPQKFAAVHRVFGASNVKKFLSNLSPCNREEAAASLFYEAQMRIQDPVYGCVGIILLLEEQLQKLKYDLSCAWAELARLELEKEEILREGLRREEISSMEELLFPDWAHQQRMMAMNLKMDSSGSAAQEESPSSMIFPASAAPFYASASGI